MKLIELRLRGFKGIKAGMGLDEIAINFNDLPTGIAVISAANGTGKTTILDNMHPYRLLPYRTGNSYKPTAFSYYEHTYGDAEKELVFEINGATYRSLVLIDTDRKKSEAYLWRNDKGQMIPEPGIDGKLDGYDKAVEAILGSPELYFTSVFRSQNAKQLADYAKGDIKDLFTELLNIDHLKLISEKARRVKQDLAGKVELLMIERKRLQDIIADEATIKSNMEAALADIADCAGEVVAHEQEIITLQEKINECDVLIAMQRRARDEVETIKAAIRDKMTKLSDMRIAGDNKTIEIKNRFVALYSKIEKAKALAVSLPTLQNMSSIKTAKEEELAETTALVAQIDENLTTLNASLNEILTIDKQLSEKQGELRQKVQKRHTELKLSEVELAEARKQADIIKNNNCPIYNPTCKLMAAAVAARDRITDIECDIEFYRTVPLHESILQNEIEDIKASRRDPAAVQLEIKKISNEKIYFFEQRQTLERAIKTITDQLKTLPLAEQAEQELPTLEQELVQINAELVHHTETSNAEIAALDAEIVALTAKINAAGDTGPDHEEEKKRLTELQASHRADIADAHRNDTEAKKTLGACEESLRQIGKAQDSLNSVVARIAYLNDEAGQWGTLEKAFGNDGIIALELDDAGPQISAIANELLKEFGGRFSVRIDTQTAKANNKGMKEVFEINVIDSATNEVKNILRLSGGERTWVNDAITKAIAIYNAQASGHAFKTIFTDELDGSLDPEKKKEFFAMKRKVLELGGYDREFCITQTESLTSMADSVIKLSRDNGIEIITQ